MESRNWLFFCFLFSVGRPPSRWDDKEKEKVGRGVKPSSSDKKKRTSVNTGAKYQKRERNEDEEDFVLYLI